MAPRAILFETVRAMGLRLPNVEVATTYGSPALKVRGSLLACLASHKSAEPHTLVVRVGFEARDELIAADPAVYYLTEHYVTSPVVLVRLSRIDRNALGDLLLSAWRFVTSATGKRSLRPKRN